MSTTERPAEPWIRIPPVHTGPRGGDPVPCPVRCIPCGQQRDGCATGPCAPICAQARPLPGAGPVHVCVITTHVAARLIVRRSSHQSSYTGPDGKQIDAAPIAWPLLLVDFCPHCGRPHHHTIQDPGPRWFRKPLTCRPYLIILRRTR